MIIIIIFIAIVVVALCLLVNLIFDIRYLLQQICNVINTKFK